MINFHQIWFDAKIDECFFGFLLHMQYCRFALRTGIVVIQSDVMDYFCIRQEDYSLFDNNCSNNRPRFRLRM